MIEGYIDNRKRNREKGIYIRRLKEVHVLVVVAVIPLYLEIHFKTNICIYMCVNITYISCKQVCIFKCLHIKYVYTYTYVHAMYMQLYMHIHCRIESLYYLCMYVHTHMYMQCISNYICIYIVEQKAFFQMSLYFMHIHIQ